MKEPSLIAFFHVTLFIQAILGQGPPFHNFKAPPTFTVNPRTAQIPIDDPVNSRIATITVSGNDDAPVSFSIEPGTVIVGGPFSHKDGSDYFAVSNIKGQKNKAVIKLKKSLLNNFQVGDYLAASIVADNGGITVRHEINVILEAPVHGGNPPDFSQPPPSAESENEEDSSQQEKEQNKDLKESKQQNGTKESKNNGDDSIVFPDNNNDGSQQQGQQKQAGGDNGGGGGDEQAGSTNYVFTLVPVFIVTPALALVTWLFRRRLNRACCHRLKKKRADEKDDIKLEDGHVSGLGGVAGLSGGRSSVSPSARKSSASAPQKVPQHQQVNNNSNGGQQQKQNLKHIKSYPPSSGVNSAETELYNVGGTDVDVGSLSKDSLEITNETSHNTTTILEDHRDDPELLKDSYSSPEDAASTKWEFPRHQLRILNMLGEGCFGQVWKYEAENIAGIPGLSTVAVKTLRHSAGDREKQDLLHELEMMKLLDPHPNVVKLLGCCTEKDPILIILEYVDGGTLQDHLRKSRSEHNYRNLHGDSENLTARDLTSYAFQTAKGMSYLSSKKVIHRDLAARNVLIDKNQVCKVADFGFARDIMANNIYERKSEGRLPIRWMAPESLYDALYTTKSDVWSFGVLMWEIVALGSTPYPGKSASEVMRFVREGGRLEKPPHCDRQLFNIMSYCWQALPGDRPEFSQLVDEFEKLLVHDTDYIDLNMFPEHAYYNEVSLSDERV